ncbi:craniofacial development protein 2-like [Helianthus annuus]|uniref:craniofacial development protein 2-like n=1 Tax=Helianthus annuus TaxID=4232 RepID=UPI000B8F06B4|nr:craniofacial development protein 2-like [Helianthus annuus]
MEEEFYNALASPSTTPAVIAQNMNAENETGTLQNPPKLMGIEEYHGWKNRFENSVQHDGSAFLIWETLKKKFEGSTEMLRSKASLLKKEFELFTSMPGFSWDKYILADSNVKAFIAQIVQKPELMKEWIAVLSEDEESVSSENSSTESSDDDEEIEQINGNNTTTVTGRSTPLQCRYHRRPAAHPYTTGELLVVIIDNRSNDFYVRSCPRTRDAGKGKARRCSLRVASWNVGTLSSKLLEVIDALKRRRVQIACLQETRWKGQRADERNGYKLLYFGSDGAKNGVGFLVSIELHKNVIEVTRHNDRIMVLRLVLGEQVVTVVCAYAPQAGLGDQEKREFWDCLDVVVRAIPREEKVFIGGNFNGHIGKDSDGFELVHGGFGFGDRNDPGRDLLDFATAHGLGIINSFFKKRESHLITFSSGGRNTQIDYLLMRQEDRRMWMNCQVLPRETAATQHHLLVADIALKVRLTEGERKTRPRTRWGNLKGEKLMMFRDKVTRSHRCNQVTTQTGCGRIWRLRSLQWRTRR